MGGRGKGREPGAIAGGREGSLRRAPRPPRSERQKGDETTKGCGRQGKKRQLHEGGGRGGAGHRLMGGVGGRGTGILFWPAGPIIN